MPYSNMYICIYTQALQKLTMDLKRIGWYWWGQMKVIRFSLINSVNENWFFMDTLTTSLWATWSSGRPLVSTCSGEGAGWRLADRKKVPRGPQTFAIPPFVLHDIRTPMPWVGRCAWLSHRWGSCLIHGRCELWWQISWDTISVLQRARVQGVFLRIFGGHTKIRQAEVSQDQISLPISSTFG